MGGDNVTAPPALLVTSCLPYPTKPHLGLVLYSWGSSAFFSSTQHYYSWSKWKFLACFTNTAAWLSGLAVVPAVVPLVPGKSRISRWSPTQICGRPMTGFAQSNVLRPL